MTSLGHNEFNILISWFWYSYHFREENPRICDIFVKVGPFLKLYTSYIRGFEAMQASFDDARKRLPEFDRATKDFEVSFSH